MRLLILLLSFTFLFADYSLTINTIPYNTKIIIKNSKYRYYDGIVLPKGIYEIQISAKGYKTKEGKIELNKDTTLTIKLEEESNTQYFKEKKLKNLFFDKETNLLWQKELNNKKYTFWEAKEYCENLTIGDYSNWRLPTYDELNTIVSDSLIVKGKILHIKKELANTTYNKPYWSSSNFEDFDTKAIVIDFGYGIKLIKDKKQKFYVRCVW